MLQLTPEQFEHYRKHKYTCFPPGYIVHRVVIKAKHIFPCQILIILAHTFQLVNSRLSRALIHHHHYPYTHSSLLSKTRTAVVFLDSSNMDGITGFDLD